MLPTLVEVPPEGDNWIHEIKYDGYRTLIVLDGKGARAYTRRGADWSTKYATILDEADLKCRDAIVDGEMYLPGESGAANFVEFRRAIKGRPKSLVFMAFDVLHLDGLDRRRQPLLMRKEALAGLIPVKGNIRYVCGVVMLIGSSRQRCFRSWLDSHVRGSHSSAHP